MIYCLAMNNNLMYNLGNVPAMFRQCCGNVVAMLWQCSAMFDIIQSEVQNENHRFIFGYSDGEYKI